MPRSTSSERFDAESAGFPDEQGDARLPANDKKIHIEPNDDRPNSMSRPGEEPALQELLRWLTRSLAILAVLTSFALLCVGATPLLRAFPTFMAKAAFPGWSLIKKLLSSIPLLLAGASYIVLQAILRPRPLELVKRLMLGIAFLLWGVVQLMPVSDLAVELGNVVIALYVVDLGLIIWSELQKKETAC